MSEVGYTVSTNSNASGRNTPIVLVYESHGQDCRYKFLGDVCSTVSQKYGTGGGNVPIIVDELSERDRMPKSGSAPRLI